MHAGNEMQQQCYNHFVRKKQPFKLPPRRPRSTNRDLFFSELFGPVVNYGEKQNIKLQNFVLVGHPTIKVVIDGTI